MRLKSTKIPVIAFILFVAVCIVFSASIVFNAPVETGYSSNGMSNLNNGGQILEDEGFLFYSDSSGNLYRTESNGSAEPKKIAENCDGRIQVYNNIYFFVSGKSLKSCNIDGNNVKTVIKYAKNPIIVGITVFYLDNQGNICKMSMRTTKSFVVVPSNKGAKEFVTYYKKIYYTDKNGNIRKVGYDGNNDKLFANVNAKSISIDNQYIFFLDNGTVHSMQLSDSKFVKNTIVKADSYVVHNENIMFTRDGKTLFGNMDKVAGNDNSKKLKTISENKCSSLSVDSEGVFYFFEGSTLKSFNTESSKTKKLS